MYNISPEDVLNKHFKIIPKGTLVLSLNDLDKIYAAMTEYASLNRQGWTREVEDLKLGIEYWKGKYETACILLDRNKPESEQIKEYIEAIERADKLYESHVVVPLQQKVLELEEVIYQLKLDATTK